LLSERRRRGLVERGVERGIRYIRWSITLLYNHLRQNRHCAARSRGLVERGWSVASDTFVGQLPSSTITFVRIDTTRHGTGGSSKLLVSLSCVCLRVNLPLQPRSPQTPLAPVLSFAQERKESKGGSYVLVVSRRRVIARHSDSGALRAWREWSERTASRGRSIRRFSIASSCGGVGRCNVPPRGRGSRFTVGSRQDAGSPSLAMACLSIYFWHSHAASKFYNPE
jgi:hypothetical protein